MDEEQDVDEVDDIDDVDEFEDGETVSPLTNHDTPKEILLHCRIILIRNGIASMVLTDQKGHQSFAESKVTRLKVCGISPKSGKFDIVIAKPGNDVEVTLRTARKERPLSPLEWRFMSETIEQVLSDNKLCEEETPIYSYPHDKKAK
jgi:hypothetical protein